MFKARFAIFLMTAFALLLGTLAAQDAGQFLILNAQYGNEHNHEHKYLCPNSARPGERICYPKLLGTIVTWSDSSDIDSC